MPEYTIRPENGRLPSEGNQSVLYRKFRELHCEESPLVRRAVAENLGILGRKVNTDLWVRELVPLIKALADDDIEKIRSLALSSLVSAAEILPEDINRDYTVPQLAQFSKDKAWKIKAAFAQILPQTARALKEGLAESRLLPMSVPLLSDAEGEVRLSAIKYFPSLFRVLSRSVYPSILPVCVSLCRDSIALVRVHALDLLSTIIPGLSREDIGDTVIHMLTQLLRSDNYTDVRVETVRALTVCAQYLGGDLFIHLSRQDIGLIIKDKQWRVRAEGYTLMAKSTLATHSQQLFEIHYQTMFMDYLKDTVYMVRSISNDLLKVLLSSI